MEQSNSSQTMVITPANTTTYRSFDDFQRNHTVPKNSDNKKSITNTRIGDTGLNIYGCSYSIPDNEYKRYL
jgi:hypothetical protein